MTEAFPLQWPAGRPRRAPSSRKRGKFKTSRESARGDGGIIPVTIATALERLKRELDALGARYPVISSNLETRLNGLPRSGQREPTDPAVAVYFHLGGKPHCLPCDTYDRAADNIAAVAAHIEATRAIERHGVASVTEMFAGFQALPPPDPWWAVLGIPQDSDHELIEAAYRSLAKRHHPDAGGDVAAWHRIQKAIGQARERRA